MVRFFLIVSGIAIGAITCVWSNLQVRRVQYEITEVKKELRRERRSYKQVRIQFEKLRSPSRLQKLREKENLNFVSRSRAQTQQLTPGQMRKVIRRKRLAGMNGADGPLRVEGEQ